MILRSPTFYIGFALRPAIWDYFAGKVLMPRRIIPCDT